jgi:hypothetical protein
MLIMKFIESLFSVLACIALVSSGRGKMINCLVFTQERLLKLEQKLLKPCLETFRPNTNGVFAPILSFRMVRIFETQKAVSKGTYPDIIFSVVLWNPDGSYSTDN